MADGNSQRKFIVAQGMPEGSELRYILKIRFDVVVELVAQANSRPQPMGWATVHCSHDP